MLFDMKNDKNQSINILDYPENKNIVEKYSRKLKNMRDFSENKIYIE